MNIGEFTSRIKGHHVCNFEYHVGQYLLCKMEPTNKHSQNAIAVKKRSNVIYHVPEALAFKLFTSMKEGKVYRVNATIPDEKRKAPEGTWVLSGGIEIPCKYFLHGLAVHETFIRNELRR